MSTFTKAMRECHERYYGWRDEDAKEPDYRQYKEKKALHLFMQYRFKTGYVKYEDAAQYIRKHIEGHDYTNDKIPYKKIRKKNCFCTKEIVDEAIEALEDFYDMYYADDENIDYAINNPISQQPTQMTNDIMASMVNCALNSIQDPAFIQQMLTEMEKQTDPSDASRKMILNMVINNPELYSQFSDIINQYASQLTIPFQTQSTRATQFQQPHVELGDVATAAINNPEINAGVDPTATPTTENDGSYAMSFNNGTASDTEPEPAENANAQELEQTTDETTNTGEENKDEQQTSNTKTGRGKGKK